MPLKRPGKIDPIDFSSPEQVHAQLQRWVKADQDPRDRRWIPFLKANAELLAKDPSKANAMRLWMHKDDVDATGPWDPLDEGPRQQAYKRFIRDNIKTIMADPGGWTSQTDGHNVVLAHILVQHMDSDPEFQAWFLDQMTSRPAVAKANADQIRYLSDRVQVNNSGYWDRADAGSDPSSIPHGTHGTQGNRYSLDHLRTQEIDEGDDMTEMRRWINSINMLPESDEPMVGDRMLIEWGDSHVVDTEIVEISEDEIILLADDVVMRFVEAINEAWRPSNSISTPTDRHRASNAFTLYPEKPATIYQPNKFNPKTGEGGYISPYAHTTTASHKLNIVMQLMNNIDQTKAEPLRFKDDSTLDINQAETIRALRKLHGLKAAERHQTIRNIMKSADAFKAFMAESLAEAEYHGRKVPLGKPMRGDVKKRKVYVRDPKTGNVKKINFGDPNMRIKRSNPKRRKSFRARHHCSNPGPRTKARYWSCRAW